MRGFRTDIQGLRGLAVLLVVLEHVFDVPQSGYVGVDVFYVISGFLITALLLRELDESESISLRAFYARRFRRIVPVALTVLLVTVIVAFLVWFRPQAIQVALDALSAALFVSNWHFLALGTDYLAVDSAVSPIQHYWSLSVEEQFYAVWPLVMLLLAAISRRRRVLVLVIVIGIVVSGAWAAVSSLADPTAAYFDTGVRAWELLAGALLAVIGTAAARVGSMTRRVVAGVGLVLIVGSAIATPAEWAVPFPAVAASVVGATMFLWADAPVGRLSLLGNPPMQWLGRVSYSLYLWHFPVLIFTPVLIPDPRVWIPVALVVMLGLSELSYRFVESPARKGSFLARMARSRNPRRIVGRDLFSGLAVLVCIAGLAVAQVHGPGWLRQYSPDPAAVASESPTLVDDQAARAEAIAEALAATSWPAAVAEQLSVATSSLYSPAMLKESPGCRNTVGQSRPTLVCRADHGDTRVMVVGDSIALSWFSTIDEVAKSEGWDLSAIGYGNCSLVDVDVTNGGGAQSFVTACRDARDEMLRIVREVDPEIIFLSSSPSALEYAQVPADRVVEAWQGGVSRTLAELSDVPLVVLLSDPGISRPPSECATPFGDPASCIAPPREYRADKIAAESRAAAGADNAIFVDATDWFCLDGRCPAFIRDTLVRADSAHLTHSAGRQAAGLLLDAIVDTIPVRDGNRWRG